MSSRGGGRTLLVRLPAAPTCAATLSAGSVAGTLLSGKVPPASPLVWPLVVLALGSMAYDLGIRALQYGAPEPASTRSASADVASPAFPSQERPTSPTAATTGSGEPAIPGRPL